MSFLVKRVDSAASPPLIERVSSFAQIPNVTKVACTRRTGLPREKPVGGKKSDLAVTVVHSPTLNGPRIHARAGVSALCIDLTVVYPCTGKGILVPNALVDAGKAKITKHAWHGGRGHGFVPLHS